MRLKILLASFILCLLISGCSHGPQVTVCPSNPSAGAFICSDSKGPQPNILYANSAGYKVYPGSSLQNLTNYCDARSTAGTAAPQFDLCTADPGDGGLDCEVATCQINAAQNGALCSLSAPYFIAWADSANAVAFSPPDNTTLLAFCNVTIEDDL